MTSRLVTVDGRPPGHRTDWRAWPRLVRRVLTDQVLPVAPQTGVGAAEDRMIAGLRCVIALASLAVVWIDPSHSVAPALLTYASLLTFLGFSVAMYLEATGRIGPLRGISQWSHWVDLVCFTWLTVLSGGTRSVFFTGYFFAILTASFRWGFRSGALVTLSSVFLFCSVGLVITPRHPLELGRALVRPVYLMVLGYMIAYWGEFHVSSTERLALLRDVTTLSNPRFGIDRTIANVLRRLRAFYHADACVLLTPSPAAETAAVWRCEAGRSETLERAVELPAVTVGALLSLDASDAVACTGLRAADRPTSTAPRADADERTGSLERIAEILNARSFMTVPWPQVGRSWGRLYVTSSQPRRFRPGDLGFLQQVINQIMPTLENVRLVDRLATDAAEAERLRIARDLHDTVVQPYIGIHMGLAAIGHKLRGRQDVTKDIEHLSHVISLEIDDLRQYLRGLKNRGQTQGALVDALTRFAHRFSDATGIALALEVDGEVRVNDRLAAEAFQMVAEAVSNARRHTESREIGVRVRGDRQLLTVQVRDRGTSGQPGGAFAPRSLGERAAALGGRVRVESAAADGGSVVTIEIPL